MTPLSLEVSPAKGMPPPALGCHIIKMHGEMWTVIAGCILQAPLPVCSLSMMHFGVFFDTPSVMPTPCQRGYNGQSSNSETLHRGAYRGPLTTDSKSLEGLKGNPPLPALSPARGGRAAHRVPVCAAPHPGADVPREQRPRGPRAAPGVARSGGSEGLIQGIHGGSGQPQAQPLTKHGWSGPSHWGGFLGPRPCPEPRNAPLLGLEIRTVAQTNVAYPPFWVPGVK